MSVMVSAFCIAGSGDVTVIGQRGSGCAWTVWPNVGTACLTGCPAHGRIASRFRISARPPSFQIWPLTDLILSTGWSVIHRADASQSDRVCYLGPVRYGSALEMRVLPEYVRRRQTGRDVIADGPNQSSPVHTAGPLGGGQGRVADAARSVADHSDGVHHGNA